MPPQVLSAEFDRPTVIGTDTHLVVAAVDPRERAPRAQEPSLSPDGAGRLALLDERGAPSRGAAPPPRERALAARRHGLLGLNGEGDYFSHVAPGGVVLNTRLRRAGYLPARRWQVGENLAHDRGRQSAPIAILRAWLGSPPHRANLFERGFREVGLGVVKGQPGGSQARGATANFGFRR